MKTLRFLLAVSLIAMPAAANAQVTGTPPKLIISKQAIARALAERPPAQPSSSRDSVKNGAIIGAVIGGVTLGVFGTYLCNALKEEGDPPCWRGVLTIGALGAGVGAAAGAGIDALATKGTRITPMKR